MNLHDRFVQKYGRPPTERDPDYLEMLNMSKYRILDRPDQKMAKCANCGSVKVDGRKYVDFGLDVDWYGIVFLCGLCVLDIAKEMDVFRDLIVKIETLEYRNKTLSNLLSAQGDAIESAVTNMAEEVKNYFDALGRNIDSYDSRPDHVHTDIPESPTGGSKSDETESAAPGNSGKITEPATSSGPKNFSSLAELLDPGVPYTSGS